MGTAITAKEQLQRAINDLTEDEAADLLQVLTNTRDLDGETATRILDGIPGAFKRAQLGLQQARKGKATSLEDLRRARR